MRKLYIFCSAGMSSSVVAKKMQLIADEKKLDLEVKFFPESNLHDKGKEADVILLTPQVKYQEKRVREDYSDKPVYLIEMLDYGMINAEAILSKCLEYSKL